MRWERVARGSSPNPLYRRGAARRGAARRGAAQRASHHSMRASIPLFPIPLPWPSFLKFHRNLKVHHLWLEHPDTKEGRQCITFIKLPKIRVFSASTGKTFSGKKWKRQRLYGTPPRTANRNIPNSYCLKLTVTLKHKNNHWLISQHLCVKERQLSK